MFRSKTSVLFVLFALYCGAAMSHDCSENYPGWGCVNGYCCIKCEIPVPFVTGAWCYSSKADYSQSFQYIPCKSNGECPNSADTRCAGACGVI